MPPSADTPGSSDETDENDDGLAVRVLLPDGGQQMEQPEQEEEAEQAEEEAEAEEEADEAEGQEAEEAEEDEEEAEEAEDDEVPEEREDAEVEEGTRLLHLNLDGLYLNLLGLEVDLDTVTLDLTAVTGEGNLLGNLLDAVAGLLDSPDLLGMLGLGDGDGMGLPGLPGLPSLPELNPMERAREVASALADRIREVIGDVIAALPLEEVLAQLLQGVVDQLLDVGGGDGDDGNGGGEQEEAEAAA